MEKDRPPKRRKRQVTSGAYASGDKRRQKLVDSTERLLSLRSIEDLSYSEIAQDAGLPLSSCYYFYKDKWELIQALSEQLGERYRREVVGSFERTWKFGRWEDLLDEHFDRSLRFVEKYPAANQVWYSPHTPPYIRARTMERDRSFALSFRPLFERYFILPDIPSLDEIFEIAKEIRDKVVTLSFQHFDHVRYYRREAKRATRAYLQCYLPSILPPAPISQAAQKGVAADLADSDEIASATNRTDACDQGCSLTSASRER